MRCEETSSILVHSLFRISVHLEHNSLNRSLNLLETSQSIGQRARIGHPANRNSESCSCCCAMAEPLWVPCNLKREYWETHVQSVQHGRSCHESYVSFSLRSMRGFKPDFKSSSMTTLVPIREYTIWQYLDIDQIRWCKRWSSFKNGHSHLFS